MNNLKIVDLIDVLRSFNVLKFCNFYSGGLVIFSPPVPPEAAGLSQRFGDSFQIFQIILVNIQLHRY